MQLELIFVSNGQPLGALLKRNQRKTEVNRNNLKGELHFSYFNICDVMKHVC